MLQSFSSWNSYRYVDASLLMLRFWCFAYQWWNPVKSIEKIDQKDQSPTWMWRRFLRHLLYSGIARRSCRAAQCLLWGTTALGHLTGSVGAGISPAKYWDLVAKPAKKTKITGSIISIAMLHYQSNGFWPSKNRDSTRNELTSGFQWIGLKKIYMKARVFSPIFFSRGVFVLRIYYIHILEPHSFRSLWIFRCGLREGDSMTQF